MELSGKKFLFLGDSITNEATTTTPDKVYWRLFGTRTGAVVKGYGISGTCIAPKRNAKELYEQQYFRSRVAEMDPDADGIVVLGGANDFGHGDAPLGKMSDREETTFYGALHCLYRALLEKYPTAEIVVMTPLHAACEWDAVNTQGLRNAAPLSGYVRIIREVAEYYSLPVLDLYAMSGIQASAEVATDWMQDGLHPKDVGHARMASRLEGFLKTL